MLVTKKNNILVLGKDFVQGINGTTIYNEYVNVSTKKAVKLTTEEYEEIIDDTTTITQNKSIVIKELVENCKPFVASSILFLSVSTILIGLLFIFIANQSQEMLYHIKQKST